MNLISPIGASTKSASLRMGFNLRDELRIRLRFPLLGISLPVIIYNQDELIF